MSDIGPRPRDEVLHHHRDEVASLLSLELPKPSGPGQRHPFPGDWPKVAGQTVDQLAAAPVVIATGVADTDRDVAKVYHPQARLLAQINQPEMAGLWTMRHRIGYGKNTIFREDAADFRKESQFWYIGQRLDIDCEIDARLGERELEGIRLQMSDRGVAVPAVSNRR